MRHRCSIVHTALRVCTPPRLFLIEGQAGVDPIRQSSTKGEIIMEIRYLNVAIVVLCLMALAACTSIASKAGGSGENGIAYYMPLRPIKVTVTVDKDNSQTPSVGPGDSIPDLGHRFILDYSENFIGKNHMNISVSAKGLLTTSNAETTSGVQQIAKNFGQLAGTIHGMRPYMAPGGPATKPAAECTAGQTYTVLLFPEKIFAPTANAPQSVVIENLICKFQITLTQGWSSPRVVDVPSSIERKDSQFKSGVFYRHDLPYIVTMTDIEKATNQPIEFLAFSPDESEIGFVPVTRTLFADNKTNISFNDGVVTSVDQSADGEVVALTQLPADIIGAYFEAVGKIFQSFSSNTTAEKSLIVAQQDLAVTKVKKQACDAAIAANSLAGKTPDEFANALNNIKNACEAK